MALERAAGSVVRLGAPVEPVARFARGAVVALEEHEGVVAHPRAIELGDDLPDAIVHGRDHRSHDAALRGQIGEAVEVFRRRVQWIVRCVEWEIEEERDTGPGRPADVVNGALRHELGEVAAVRPDLAAVLPEIVDRIGADLHVEIEDVRVVVDAAGHESEPLFEAVVLRPRPLGESEVPLPEHRGPVAGRAQRRRDRRHVAGKAGRGPMAAQDRADPRVPWIAACEQACSRRGADRGVRVPAAKERAGCGEGVEVRRRQVLRAHAAEVAIGLVIAEYHDEARPSDRCYVRRVLSHSARRSRQKRSRSGSSFCRYQTMPASKRYTS